MPNPYISGGQLTNSSTQEPERIFEFTKGQRTILPATSSGGAPTPPASQAMPFGRPNALSRGAPPASGSRVGMPFGPPNALSRGAEAGAASSLGGPVPSGRSGRDVNRIAERMLRRKDPRGVQFLFGQAMQKDGQEFQREMFGAHQQASAERDATNFDQGLYMFGKQQEAQKERDATNYDQGIDMFGKQQAAEKERYDRARNDQLTDEQKKKGFTVQPLDPNDPSKGNVIVRGDGSLFNVLPGERPEPKPSMVQIPGTGDYVPMFGNQQVSGAPLYQEQPGWSVNGKPKLAPKQDAKAEKPVVSWGDDGNGGRIPYQQIVNPETGEVTLRRVKIIDENGDGVDDRQQGGGAGAGGAAPAARPAGQTSSGNKWTPKK